MFPKSQRPWFGMCRVALAGAAARDTSFLQSRQLWWSWGGTGLLWCLLSESRHVVSFSNPFEVRNQSGPLLVQYSAICSLSLKILFIDLFESERVKECEQGERERERERERISSRLRAEHGARRAVQSQDPEIMT